MSAIDSPAVCFQCMHTAGGSAPALVAIRRHDAQLKLFPVPIAMTCGGTLNVAAARVVPGIRRDVTRAWLS